MDTISVIIPVYQVKAYLSRCVGSVCAQTHKNLEIWLIDDGSTDGSGQLCDALAAGDSRIRVIHQENRGLSAARNAGLDRATGAYIAFVDADDWIGETMLETLLHTLKTTGADMALCNIRCEPGADTPMTSGCLSQGEFLDCLLGDQAWFYITVCNKLCWRAVWDGLRFPEGYIYEDEAVIYRVAARCRQVAVTDKVLYHYLRRPESITGRGFRVETTDKLYALADRIGFCGQMGWKTAWEANCLRFSHTFLEYYLAFPRAGAQLPYFRRMEQNLAAVLPQLLRSRQVRFRHKLYLSCIRVSPGLFFRLREWKRRILP